MNWFKGIAKKVPEISREWIRQEAVCTLCEKHTDAPMPEVNSRVRFSVTSEIGCLLGRLEYGEKIVEFEMDIDALRLPATLFAERYIVPACDGLMPRLPEIC